MTRLAPLLVALLGGLVLATRADAGNHADWERALATHPLKDAAGNVVRVADLKGEVVVVSFWASWCKPCKRELTALDGWIHDAGAAHGPAPRVLAVSIDQDPRKATRFVQDAALRLPVYLDGPNGLARSLDLPSLPITLVIDRDGHIAGVAEHGSPEELAQMEHTVRALLSEAPPARVPASEEQKDNSGSDREGQG